MNVVMNILEVAMLDCVERRDIPLTPRDTRGTDRKVSLDRSAKSRTCSAQWD